MVDDDLKKKKKWRSQTFCKFIFISNIPWLASEAMPVFKFRVNWNNNKKLREDLRLTILIMTYQRY